MKKEKRNSGAQRRFGCPIFDVYKSDIPWIAGLVALFVVCLELFYRMIVNYNGRYESDMQYYAVNVPKDGLVHVRLIENLSQILYSINHNTLEFNFYLASVIPAIVIANYYVIKYFLKRDCIQDSIPRYSIQIASFIALFAGPIYVPILHEYYYIRSFRCFAWHNPTHQSMLLFSLVATLCFLEMFRSYEDGVSKKWWLATSITCLLSAYAKPSFIINLSFTVVILFIIELIIKGKEGFAKRLAKLFAMGCTLIPSCIYTLWMSTFEFTEDASGGENHVVFGLEVLKRYDNIFSMFIFGVPFAIAVCLINGKRFKESKYYFTLIMFAAGVAQWAFIGETGSRIHHGNFGWGRMYGNYFLTLVCLALLLENIYCPDSVFAEKKKVRKICIIAAIVVLVLSVVSQLNYFRLILTGHGYMM